ncbi:MAG: hypothetical protein ACTSP5_00275 [Candidatus Heimdallarchaeota archaeon]
MSETQVDSQEERSGKLNNFIRKFGFYVVPIAIGTLLAFVAIIVLIIALIILKWGTTPANSNVFFTTSAVLFICGILFFFFGYIPYKIDRKNSGRDIVEKLEKFRNLDLSKNQDSTKFSNTYYDLVSKAPQELAEYMSDNLELYQNNPLISQEGLNQMLYTLAVKLGYSTTNRMLAARRSGESSAIQSVDDKIKIKRKDDLDLSIPVTKVYFVKELPIGKNCMIKGLPLDFKNDKVVACPHCGNMAERDPLVIWVNENKKCPICKKTLLVDDISLVVIKNLKK